MPTKQTSNNEEQDLRAQHPNAWIALEEGDKLEGQVLDITLAWSDARAGGNNGDGFYPLVRVVTDDGTTLAFHAFSAVSYNEVAEKQPLPGERIVITYQGLASKAKPGQNAAKLFHVHLPNRDPKIAAANVYGQLKNRMGRNVSVAQPPTSDTSDIPTADEFGF